MACKEGRGNCVELLLLKGSDASIKNNKKKTPADVVNSDDNKKRILLLIDKAVHGQCIDLY